MRTSYCTRDRDVNPLILLRPVSSLLALELLGLLVEAPKESPGRRISYQIWHEPPVEAFYSSFLGPHGAENSESDPTSCLSRFVNYMRALAGSW